MEYTLLHSQYDNLETLSVVERILTNRRIPLEEVQHYLNTTNKDIHSPMLIDNIEQGAKMLIQHIANNDKVFIQIDSDCDGFTSAAALLNYLYKLFPAFVQNNIQYRQHTGKQHGLLLDTVPKDVKLVIAPDSSSNDYVEHQTLQMQGIDVLVIDHHEADYISPYACVLNNQLCNYPNKSLSGVGMVYKFCCYIDSLLGVNYADSLLDLVALGMIADMMDLRDPETKHLINLGLNQINNPFFRTMVSKQSYSLGDMITPIGVAFYIAPYVNAVVRVGKKEDKLILFESMLDYKGYEQIRSTKRGCSGQMETRAEQACRICTNAKSKQTKLRDKALELIEDIIKDQHLLDHKLLIIQLEQKDYVDKNLTGLIANNLMAKYQRPTLVLNQVDNDGIVTWEGSGRGYDKSVFKNFRNFIDTSSLSMYAQGHANAFGAGFTQEHIQSLIEYSDKALADLEFSPSYQVDYILNSNELNVHDIIEIADLKTLWGQNIDEPLIAIENVKVSNITLMSADKSPTLKIILPNGISLIKFKSSKEEYERLKSENDYQCFNLNIIGRCEKNVWNGRVNAQIIIEDYEVINETKWYF